MSQVSGILIKYDFCLHKKRRASEISKQKRHMWQQRQKLEWDSYKQRTPKIGNHHQKPRTGKEKLYPVSQEHGPTDTLILNL